MLKDLVPQLVEHISANKDYINHNYVLNDIFNGRLLPYVLADLEKSISSSYFRDVKERMLPINILTKLIEKFSKSYADDPVRNPVDENSSDQELIDFYEDDTQLNKQMNVAEGLSFLFKGYALEPFIDNGEVGIRPLPFDRFLVYSTNAVNPLKMTVFIKFMGKRKIVVKDGEKDKEVFYAYTDAEFWAFDEDGDTYAPALDGNDGVNPFGVIPFYYANRGTSLLPIQDTDILAMIKTLPKLLSDLSGSMLYNSFPIVYTTDIDTVDLQRNPNTIWNFKSDLDSGKTPTVGTITPQSDIQAVLDFIAKSLAMWLESKGLKTGGMGTADVNNVSGISKILDEVDTLEIRKISILEMEADEKGFWEVLKAVHNHWIDSGELTGKQRFTDNFKLSIVFDEPKVFISRKELVEQVKFEVDAGFLPMNKAIEILYPDLTPDEIEERTQQQEQKLIISAPVEAVEAVE